MKRHQFETICCCNLMMSAVLVVLVLTVDSVWAATTCNVADDVAKKGFTQFATDQRAGIALFTKALELCPDEPAHAYNLGLAYKKYGLAKEAVRYLEQAVARQSTPAWQLSLADAYRAAGMTTKAVELAEKVLNNERSPRAADLLVHLDVAQKRFAEALARATKMVSDWPEEKRLHQRLEQVQTAYLQYYLELIDKGDTAAGLQGLKNGSGFIDGARAYCMMLATTGRVDEALTEVSVAITRFPGASELVATKDKLFALKLDSIYQSYRSGNKAQALSAAKDFTERNPANGEAKRVYDELFNDYTGIAVLTDLPGSPAVKPGPGKTAGFDIDTALARIPLIGGDQTVTHSLKSDVDVNIPEARRKNPEAVAVVIGNQRYARSGKGVADVSFAERDAAIMRQYLVKTMGYSSENIIFKIDASLVDMLDIFGSGDGRSGKLYNWLRQGKSDVFVYYVGHGAPHAKGESSYLVPVNGSAENIESTGYELEKLYLMAEKLPARSVTMVIDACFSGDSQGGPLLKNISPVMVMTSEPVRSVENTVIFAGAGKGEVATWYSEKGHSTFTYYFLKGLGGAADHNGNGAISVAEMSEYLHEEVPHRARRQSDREQNPVIMGNSKRVLVELR